MSNVTASHVAAAAQHEPVNDVLKRHNLARHIYGDWIRHKSGKVAVICPGDLRNYNVFVKFHDGKIEHMSIFDYDLITEHEFYEQVDPSYCGPTIQQLVDSFHVNQVLGEDWFTGGKMRTAFPKQKEDLFT